MPTVPLATAAAAAHGGRGAGRIAATARDSDDLAVHSECHITTALALPPPAITEGQCTTTARHDCNPRTINVTTARRMMTDATGDGGGQPRHTFGSANAAQPAASHNAVTRVPPTAADALHTANGCDNNPRTLHSPTLRRLMTEAHCAGNGQPRQASSSANAAQPTASHNAATRVTCTTERARHITDTIRDGTTHQMRLGLAPSAVAAAGNAGRDATTLLMNNRVTDWVDVLRLTEHDTALCQGTELSRDAFSKKIEECKQMLLAAASALKKKEFKKRKPRHALRHAHDCATPAPGTKLR